MSEDVRLLKGLLMTKLRKLSDSDYAITCAVTDNGEYDVLLTRKSGIKGCYYRFYEKDIRKLIMQIDKHMKGLK